MCVLIFSTILSESFLILRRIERDVILVQVLNVKYPLFMSDFSRTGIFFGRFSKKPQRRNFMKIQPVGAEMFYAY